MTSSAKIVYPCAYYKKVTLRLKLLRARGSHSKRPTRLSTRAICYRKKWASNKTGLCLLREISAVGYKSCPSGRASEISTLDLRSFEKETTLHLFFSWTCTGRGTRRGFIDLGTLMPPWCLKITQGRSLRKFAASNVPRNYCLVLRTRRRVTSGVDASIEDNCTVFHGVIRPMDNDSSNGACYVSARRRIHA